MLPRGEATKSRVSMLQQKVERSTPPGGVELFHRTGHAIKGTWGIPGEARGNEMEWK
jgi:hypothetical protein